MAGQEAAGGPCEGEPDAVVQRTQVLLLAGEPWGPDGGQSLLSAFARHALPPTGLGGPGSSPCSSPGKRPPQQPLPCPPAPAGRLIFFLCRAASLRERPERLREVLRGVREQNGGGPAAVVGVLVQPRPDEEAEARARLEELLRDTFCGASVETHTAVFAPGRPQGSLELRRVGDKSRRGTTAAAPPAPPAPSPPPAQFEPFPPPAQYEPFPPPAPYEPSDLSDWSDVSTPPDPSEPPAAPSGSSQKLDILLLMQVLGALLSLGTMAFGGFYLYSNPV